MSIAHTTLKYDVLRVLQANWYRAAQYCRYHGMHLASISSQEENDKLEKHIRDFGTNVFMVSYALNT
jgi:hypothetical protein